MSSVYAAPNRTPAISVAAIVWALAVALFVLARVGLLWRAPVGGLELEHLSGAWLASIGVEDARYVPTFVQSLMALTLGWTDSEVPARALALAGTLTIPLALFLLRHALGQAGALFALLLLALDPAGIVLGATASAVAWDAAIALWLVVALVASRPPPTWVWLPLIFLVATAGPLPLPFILTATAIAAVRGERPSGSALAWGAAGAALGVLMTSLQFGLGSDGLRVVPLILFATGFTEHWSAATSGELAALYGLPLLVGGVAAVAWLAARCRAGSFPPAPVEVLTAGAAGVAVLWFLLAVRTSSPVPLAAATLACGLVLGPALARVASLLLTTRWYEGRALLPLAAGFTGAALFVLSGWARAGHAGGAYEQAFVATSLALALVILALLATRRGALPLALVPVLAAGGLVLLSGASGVALSAAGEPLPGPTSPASARAIRDSALESATGGGLVVVHERYREALTWPFRHSGTLLLASRVPPDAAVVIWPPDADAPEGFVEIEGRWILERSVRAPAGFLGYVRWFGERNSLPDTLELVAIYARRE